MGDVWVVECRRAGSVQGQTEGGLSRVGFDVVQQQSSGA